MKEDNEECKIFRDEADLEAQVNDMLIRHVSFQEKMGASANAISIIRNQYITILREAPNDISYLKESSWDNEAVEKLRRAKIVRDVFLKTFFRKTP